MARDSIGHLETLCVSVLSLSHGVESEWKRCSSPLSVDKKQNRTKQKQKQNKTETKTKQNKKKKTKNRTKSSSINLA